jgi:hypothetical protein
MVFKYFLNDIETTREEFVNVTGRLTGITTQEKKYLSQNSRYPDGIVSFRLDPNGEIKIATTPQELFSAAFQSQRT